MKRTEPYRVWEANLPVTIPSDLLPNRKMGAHWGTFTDTRKQLRMAVKGNANAILPRGFQPLRGLLLGEVWVTYDVNRTLPDLDNTAAACKAVLDGLQDARVMKNDRDIVELRYHHRKGTTATGSVYVRLTELEKEPSWPGE